MEGNITRNDLRKVLQAIQEHRCYRNIGTATFTTATVTITLQHFTEVYLKWNTKYFFRIIQIISYETP